VDVPREDGGDRPRPHQPHRAQVACGALLANVDEKVASKFNLQKFRIEAKHNARERERRVKLMQTRAKRNAELGAAGKMDEEANAALGMPDSVAQDHLSTSPTLIGMAWLSTHRKGRVWFDEFANNVFSDWDGTQDDRVVPAQAVDDTWLLRNHVTLMRSDARLAKIPRAAAMDAAYAVAFDDTRNAPRDWVKSLVWDKTPRLETWLREVYGTPQDAYHAAVGRCWLVSMVARMIGKGAKVHTMPVLIGPEGTRKSTSLEILGGTWYGSISVSAEKLVDFLMTLNGRLVGEIAELDALMNKRTEFGRVKNLLSTAEDIYRAPYGRTTGTHLRTCVMVGTTNDWHWYKDDGTGRRFWPFICDKPIDCEWLIANRDQLYAEALELYNRGHKKHGDPGCWWDVPIEEQRAAVQEHHVGDLLEERLQDWLNDPRLYSGRYSGVLPLRGDITAVEEHEHWGTIVTTNRICTLVMGQPGVTAPPPVIKRIARVMQKLGWKNAPIRTGRGADRALTRGWVKSVELTSDQGQLFDKVEE
jgi:hypothetical protein